MRKIPLLLTGLLLLLHCAGQRKAYDRFDLFKKEDPLDIQVKTDMKNLINKKPKDSYIYSYVALKTPDSTVDGNIKIRARGNFRREYCYVPPLKFDFDTSTAPRLKDLGAIDMTCQCRAGTSFEQLIYKEYSCYRIYNILTDRSQKVRLVKLVVEDNDGKKKAVEIPGFFIEDLDVTAKRNACKKIKMEKLHTENTDRKQMTMVAMFEYMIGNTDWSVYANHNIKLLQDSGNTSAKPYAVAYDFDYSGLVNASYAIPDPQLGTENVSQRVYRGFPRELGELREMADFFLSKKDAIYAEINNSKFLSNGSKKEMTSYLDEFFTQIKDDRNLKIQFIENARQL